MITVKKINNNEINIPDSFHTDKKKPAYGHQLFNEPFCNIFLSAKKNSGKTWTIFNILKKCMGPETKLIIFCSTVYNDDAWRYITKYFEDKNNDVETFTSIHHFDEDNPKLKVNVLKTILKELEDTPKEDDTHNNNDEEEQVFDPVKYIQQLHAPEKVKKKRKKVSKYRIPKIIFVFDDLSTELKDPSILHLLKRNRHFNCKTIISSQYLLDLDISGRKNIDYYLLFKNQNDKLPFVYKDAGINSMSFEEFADIYNHAVSKPYSFLYIDTRDEQFRQNFNKQYTINKK